MLLWFFLTCLAIYVLLVIWPQHRHLDCPERVFAYIHVYCVFLLHVFVFASDADYPIEAGCPVCASVKRGHRWPVWLSPACSSQQCRPGGQRQWAAPATWKLVAESTAGWLLDCSFDSTTGGMISYIRCFLPPGSVYGQAGIGLWPYRDLGWFYRGLSPFPSSLKPAQDFFAHGCFCFWTLIPRVNKAECHKSSVWRYCQLPRETCHQPSFYLIQNENLIWCTNVWSGLLEYLQNNVVKNVGWGASAHFKKIPFL